MVWDLDKITIQNDVIELKENTWALALISHPCLPYHCQRTGQYLESISKSGKGLN